MGAVFLADDTQIGRKVAIKFLTEALEADPTARERLQREARAAAALDHPYICKIHEIAEVDGRTGIVMEHVSGETLQASLARGPVSPRRALEIAGEIAEALDEAHRHRLVHRDLKPANVMLTEQGHVKVMDFGLAKAIESASGPLDNAETVVPLTESGVRVGTPGYMAPELLLGGQADTRSDIFAFGILIFEMLAGVHPFQRTSQSGTMAAILRDTPPPVTQYQETLPESAKAALDRLLVKEPERRHQSFAEVRADLKRLLDDISGVTPMSRLTPTVSAAETPSVRRTPFVGREAERAQIRRLLEQAVEGRGATVLVGGEPGVGKTRFTEELLREARERGCLALVGHCYETEGQPPFIPFVELDVGRPWAKVLESLVRERLATRITLRRLPETDVEQMLEALSGQPPPAALAGVVYRETEGNPFFVEEVFQHLKEEGRLFDEAGRWRSDLAIDELQVPEGVRLVIGRRLERVSDDTRKALTVAAVIGRNFELAVLEAATGIDADALLDALEEAERAHQRTRCAIWHGQRPRRVRTVGT